MSIVIIFYITRIPLTIFLKDIYEVPKESSKKFMNFLAFLIDGSIGSVEYLDKYCPATSLILAFSRYGHL